MIKCLFIRTGFGIDFFTTSDYSETFTKDSKVLLEAYKLHNVRLVREASVPPPVETVEWQQTSRCFISCQEDYWLVDYRQEGDTASPVVKVFVAKSGNAGMMKMFILNSRK